MKKMTIILMLSAVVVLGTGCAGKYKKVEQDMKAPINCATAKGDLRILEHEKAHTMDQISQGVSAECRSVWLSVWSKKLKAHPGVWQRVSIIK